MSEMAVGGGGLGVSAKIRNLRVFFLKTSLTGKLSPHVPNVGKNVPFQYFSMCNFCISNFLCENRGGNDCVKAAQKF